MDNLSNHDLGVEVHDVPADGDCLLHSWVKAVDSVKNDELPLFFRSVASLREGLAQFFEAHASRLEQHFLKRHVWPWHRPFNEWINYDRPPASVAEYARFLRTPRTWLTNYELQALVTMAPKSLKCFTQNEQHGVWQQIPRFQMDEFLRAPPSRHVVMDDVPVYATSRAPCWACSAGKTESAALSLTRLSAVLDEMCSDASLDHSRCSLRMAVPRSCEAADCRF